MRGVTGSPVRSEGFGHGAYAVICGDVGDIHSTKHGLSMAIQIYIYIYICRKMEIQTIKT
jgi:hypothetical protein